MERNVLIEERAHALIKLLGDFVGNFLNVMYWYSSVKYFMCKLKAQKNNDSESDTKSRQKYIMYRTIILKLYVTKALFGFCAYVVLYVVLGFLISLDRMI